MLTPSYPQTVTRCKSRGARSVWRSTGGSRLYCFVFVFSRVVVDSSTRDFRTSSADSTIRWELPPLYAPFQREHRLRGPSNFLRVRVGNAEGVTSLAEFPDFSRGSNFPYQSNSHCTRSEFISGCILLEYLPRPGSRG